MTDRDEAKQRGVEVTDELIRSLPHPLADELAMQDWHDQWGTVMDFWFAVNEVALRMGWPTNASYRPSPVMALDEEPDCCTAAMLLDFARAGDVTADMLVTADQALEACADRLRELGLDY